MDNSFDVEDEDEDEEVRSIAFALADGEYGNDDVVVGNIDNSTNNDVVADNSESVSNDKNNYDNVTTNDTTNISNGEFLDLFYVCVSDKNAPSVSVRLEKKINNLHQDSNQDDSNCYVVISRSQSNIDHSNNKYGPNNTSDSIDNKENVLVCNIDVNNNKNNEDDNTKTISNCIDTSNITNAVSDSDEDNHNFLMIQLMTTLLATSLSMFLSRTITRQLINMI